MDKKKKVWIVKIDQDSYLNVELDESVTALIKVYSCNRVHLSESLVGRNMA